MTKKLNLWLFLSSRLRQWCRRRRQPETWFGTCVFCMARKLLHFNLVQDVSRELSVFVSCQSWSDQQKEEIMFCFILIISKSAHCIASGITINAFNLLLSTQGFDLFSVHQFYCTIAHRLVANSNSKFLFFFFLFSRYTDQKVMYSYCD